MRIAIFNEHWTTLGGGEQSALQIAAALQEDHQVSLLATQSISMKDLEDHCQQDLSKVQLIEIDRNRHSVECASSNFDVFINHSHQSTAMNFAKHGIYQVMFPQKIARSSRQQYSKLQTGIIQRIYGLRLELQGVDCFISDGCAWFSLNPKTQLSSILLSIAAPVTSQLKIYVFDLTQGFTTSQIRVDLTADVVHPITISDMPENCALLIQNSHSDVLDSSRVPFRLISVEDCSGVLHTATELCQFLRTDPENPKDYLDSYKTFIANSEYTKLWTKRFLGRESTVVYPPVVPSSSLSTCQKQILNIGRFFGGQGIHSKNQLQMVQSFKNLPQDLLESWRLILIGGTSREHRKYAENVRNQSINQPIDIYFNASIDIVKDYLRSASLYWHLTGYGQDLDAHPESAEHFGIAIVEAMSAGIIPLAFNAGGPREILARFPELLFNSLDELREKTIFYSLSNSKTDELRRKLVAESELFNVKHYQSAWKVIISNLR